MNASCYVDDEVPGTGARAPGNDLRYQCLRALSSKPESTACSARMSISDSPLCGQAKRPPSSRFAQTHSPDPSKLSNFTLVRARLQNPKTWPERASCLTFRTSRT